MFRIVKSSNFDKDWYNEEFVNLPGLYSEDSAKQLADFLNNMFCSASSQDWYKVVPEDYKLHIGMVA